MKYLFYLIFSMSLLSFKANEPKKIVFFGDSITQAGVNPKGYIQVFQGIADKTYPGKYKAIGAGIGGNKVYDLYLRMEEMLEHKPDVVVIFIGVNDVWHKSSSGTGTDADKFVRFYTKIIEKLKAQNIKVVLATPAAIGERTDFSNSQDGDLNHYSNLIRDLAIKQDLNLVDLRKAFLDYNLKNNPDNVEKGILTTDRVHLNEKGNAFVAEEMAKILLK
jgi:lysophospholipase L1-like esterase